MNLQGFTVIDPLIIQSIRDAGALGLYCYVKSLGGKSTISNLKIYRKPFTKQLKKSIQYLLELGLITIHQDSPTLEYVGDNLIIIK